MNLDIIIPSAGAGRRIKSYGVKALLPVSGGETLIGRQIRLLRRLFPGANLTVVLGFEQARVARTLPKDVNLVFNPHFAETNVAHSLWLGLQSCQNEAVLIVYGDLVFNQATLLPLTFPYNLSRSCVLVDCESQFGEEEVGVNLMRGYATNFAFGLKNKWAHIALLSGRERELFQGLAGEERSETRFGFEILNHVIEQGGKLLAIQPPLMKIAEIDSSKDIERASQIQ